MLNHSNRKATSVETLRHYLVPVSKKIKNGEFSKISAFHGEKLILEADWESRLVYVTIAKGGGVPMRVHEGCAQWFHADDLFPNRHFRSEDQVIGFYEGDRPKGNREKMYQEYVLGQALAAQNILESVPVDEVVSDDVKSRVRAILDPYRDTVQSRHQY